jgi:hypothetical protein
VVVSVHLLLSGLKGERGGEKRESEGGGRWLVLLAAFNAVLFGPGLILKFPV